MFFADVECGKHQLSVVTQVILNGAFFVINTFQFADNFTGNFICHFKQFCVFYFILELAMSCPDYQGILFKAILVYSHVTTYS